MDQPSLLDWQPPEPPKFLGATYKAERDGARLSAQLKAVHDVLIDGRVRTLQEIADEAHCPPASASARFRDLKRLGYPMTKKNMGGGMWVYSWVLPQKVTP